MSASMWVNLKVCKSFSKSFMRKLSLDKKNVSFSVDQNVASLRLNKPETLNALDLDMIKRIKAQLIGMEKVSDISCVLIESANNKAFCSGGDVKQIYYDGLRHHSENLLIKSSNGEKFMPKESLCNEFFSEEYQMNYILSQYKKPLVALTNGITLGGGVGLSIYSHIRVSTEFTVWSMPEVAIGFIPDVGASYFLHHLPNNFGLLSSLSAIAYRSKDSYYVGASTFYITVGLCTRILPVLQDISEKSDLKVSDIKFVLDKAHRRSNNYEDLFSLHDRVEDIKKIFSLSSLLEILDAIHSKAEWENNPQGKWTILYNKICTNSPMSMALAFELYKRGANMTIDEVLKMEFRVAQRLLADEQSDFYRGIKKRLIEKSNEPLNWKYKTIDSIPNDELQRMFEPLPDELELKL